MNHLVALIFCLLVQQGCQAQVILSCYDGKPDTSICAKVISRTLTSTKLGLYYKNAPLEICSLGGDIGISFGISERYAKAGFHLDCEEVFAEKPFNNKRDGCKHGLWFERTLWGRVKRATQYNSGRVTSVLTFWPDGLPRQFVKYKSSGQPVPGSSFRYPRS